MIGAMLDEQAEDLRFVARRMTGSFRREHRRVPSRVPLPGGLLFASDRRPRSSLRCWAICERWRATSPNTPTAPVHRHRPLRRYRIGRIQPGPCRERRAKTVKSVLVQQGVASARVRAVGRGENPSPWPTNSTPEGRQQNRRVEDHHPPQMRDLPRTPEGLVFGSVS